MDKYMKNQSELLIYQTPDGVTKIETRLQDETVWLTQAQLCELFQKSKSSISEHFKHIFEEGELDERSVVRNSRTVQKEGNKDVIKEFKKVFGDKYDYSEVTNEKRN